jgi:hypothetical protein
MLNEDHQALERAVSRSTPSSIAHTTSRPGTPPISTTTTTTTSTVPLPSPTLTRVLSPPQFPRVNTPPTLIRVVTPPKRYPSHTATVTYHALKVCPLDIIRVVLDFTYPNVCVFQ